VKVSRRAFLQTATIAGTAFAIRFHLPSIARAASESPVVFEPNAYLRITADNVVTLYVTRSEMGQGVRTSLPAVLADELEVDLSSIKLEQAIPGARFKAIRLRTSGSGSSSATFLALRRAGASAREMLISAAAEAWGVDHASCRAQSGSVIHPASGRRASYGDLAKLAAKQTAPSDPRLKNSSDFRFIGTPIKRLDGPAIVRGQALYGVDVRVPGMLVAVVDRCPYLSGKVGGFDARAALASAGVRHVVPVKSGISTGVAVVADTTWAALKGREALRVQWKEGPHRDFDSDRFTQTMQSALAEEGYPVRRQGDAIKAMASASRRLEALYSYPFQAHAPVETMNCVADVRSNSCEVWAPSQTPETARDDIVKMLGVSPESVKVHTTLMGGGFGRRLFVDYVHEAVEISKAVGKPVQVVWTRADDTRHGFFHPASMNHLVTGLDRDGRILAWVHKCVDTPLSMFGLPTEEQKKDLQRYAKEGSPWGAFDNPYNFETMKVDAVPVDCPVPTGSWRAVEYPGTVFARESFVDEIAHALGRDPLQLRIDLLQPGDVLNLGDQKIDRRRMIRVLEVAREKSGWANPIAQPSPDRFAGRGLAINVYHGGSYIAQVAEVSVARDLGDLRVHRIVCVVDCGLAINPAGLEGQAESGITWGLSATLHGKIDFRGGRAIQATYSDFQVMRMNEMPVIATHILPSDARPGGFGEHPVPPVAPAVANAVFAATGKRARKLPITAADLRA